MGFRPLPLCRLAVWGVALIASPLATAQLASKSPFQPAGTGASTTPTAGAPLEYRGYLEAGGDRQYRLHDPARKAGVWVKLNEANAEFGVTAKKYDSNERTLTVEYQGKTVTLAERQSKVVSSGAAAQALPPPPIATNVPAAVTQAVVLNPTPADEQRRLDAVAAEVQRRRALREQAAQQVNQPTPAPAAPTPAQGNYQQPAQRVIAPLPPSDGQRPVPTQPIAQPR